MLKSASAYDFKIWLYLHIVYLHTILYYHWFSWWVKIKIHQIIWSVLNAILIWASILGQIINFYANWISTCNYNQSFLERKILLENVGIDIENSSSFNSFFYVKTLTLQTRNMFSDQFCMPCHIATSYWHQYLVT